MKLGQYLGLIALILSLYILWQIRQLMLLSFTSGNQVWARVQGYSFRSGVLYYRLIEGCQTWIV